MFLSSYSTKIYVGLTAAVSTCKKVGVLGPLTRKCPPTGMYECRVLTGGKKGNLIMCPSVELSAYERVRSRRVDCICFSSRNRSSSPFGALFPESSKSLAVGGHAAS